MLTPIDRYADTLAVPWYQTMIGKKLGFVESPLPGFRVPGRPVAYT